MIKRKKCTKLDTHMDSSVKGNFYFFPILANNHVTNAYWHSRKNTNAAVKLSLFICSLSGTLKLHAVLNVEFSPLAESRFAYPTCIRRISGFAAYRSIQCYQPYTSGEVWKIKPPRTAASVEPSTHRGVRRPLFAQDYDEVFVTGSTLYAGDGGQTPLDTTPLVITLFSAAVGHCRTEPGGYFCWKLTLTRTPDHIRPTRRGPDPNRPTSGRKQGGLWPRGVCPGSFGRTPSETIGDGRTEFNRILCTSKSGAAVTSNKKLRCRYVEADYRQTRSIERPLCDIWASYILCSTITYRS